MSQSGHRVRVVTATGLLVFAGFAAAADDVRVGAGTVEDQRYSEPSLGSLSIELKLAGAGVGEVKAIRTKVRSAKDDLGRSLVRAGKDERIPEFEEFSTDRRPGPHITLMTPDRGASTIEVSGDVELFIPARDPNTKQRFEKFLSRLDKPLASPVLKAAKVEITPLSAAGYKGRQQANRPTREQIEAEGKKHGASDAEIAQAIKMLDAIAALGGEDPTETSVLVETKDPDGRIISVAVVGADGAELPAPSRGTSGGGEDKLVKIDLAQKPPADAALLVTLRTSRSVVSVPLNLKDLALP